MPSRRVSLSRRLLAALVAVAAFGVVAALLLDGDGDEGGERSASSAALPEMATPLPARTMAGLVAGPASVPAVRVEGNQLVDAEGRPLRLLGVNRSSFEYACVQGWGISEGPTDEASVQAISSWRVNAVRIPLNEHCWLGINGIKPKLGGDAYRRAVTEYVDVVNRAGLVAVLDLHWNAPAGRTADRTQRMADADHSPEFWRSVASHFRDRPGVAFDLFNEPKGIDWACWRDGCTTPGGWQAAGMQSLVDAVRAAGATQPIVATGLQYGNDLSEWLEHRPHDPLGNTAAGFHVYDFNECNDQRCWDRTVGSVAAVVPVVTTEAGQGDCRSDFITDFMRWADRRGVSYLGWTWNTWNCSDGPALIRTYEGEPTDFGAGVRRHLESVAATAASPAG